MDSIVLTIPKSLESDRERASTWMKAEPNRKSKIPPQAALRRCGASQAAMVQGPVNNIVDSGLCEGPARAPQWTLRKLSATSLQQGYVSSEPSGVSPDSVGDVCVSVFTLFPLAVFLCSRGM